MNQRVYNYRLTRARQMVECTFGILANKWQIFKACCVLHNFVRKKDGIRVNDELYESPMQSCHPTGTRAKICGLKIRDYFANYFTSPEGSRPWQYDKI
ncbi:unnamed protein product [Acanthoscelides obtectus]|uniref:DDE Tnp4 domain-containing protein n=1 Tax=Acanthoscelides obtectus TaxID=200917 RepID=A0A9P0K6Z2_ACAOB|nr:unnamed protein product [Acanthoscelides obtectus]CAK1655483.1 hypothetical protein AOBTE_LOCUS19189 [Acanthoscelides obtectus]